MGVDLVLDDELLGLAAADIGLGLIVGRVVMSTITRALGELR